MDASITITLSHREAWRLHEALKYASSDQVVLDFVEQLRQILDLEP